MRYFGGIMDKIIEISSLIQEKIKSANLSASNNDKTRNQKIK